MITVEDPVLLHEIEYRSSGSREPRNLTLQIFTVRYTASKDFAPTFLAAADLQGRDKHDSNRLLGELAADEIIALQELGALPACDFCLLCGDFYDYPDFRKLGGTGDVTSAINALSKTASKTFAVLGNHDEIQESELEPQVTILDGDAAEFESVTGISYAMLHRFANGDRGNGDTIDKLAEYFALELTPLKREQRKSKGS